MKTALKPLAHDSAEHRILATYVQNSHAPTHNTYTLELEQAYDISREGEKAAFTGAAVGNRALLWHGSRLTNWCGILSQGLRIAPPEAPATGYMFGKGVYFADCSSKSANYCFATKTTRAASSSSAMSRWARRSSMRPPSPRPRRCAAGWHSLLGKEDGARPQGRRHPRRDARAPQHAERRPPPAARSSTTSTSCTTSSRCARYALMVKFHTNKLSWAWPRGSWCKTNLSHHSPSPSVVGGGLPSLAASCAGAAPRNAPRGQGGAAHGVPAPPPRDPRRAQLLPAGLHQHRALAACWRAPAVGFDLECTPRAQPRHCVRRPRALCPSQRASPPAAPTSTRVCGGGRMLELLYDHHHRRDVPLAHLPVVVHARRDDGARPRAARARPRSSAASTSSPSTSRRSCTSSRRSSSSSPRRSCGPSRAAAQRRLGDADRRLLLRVHLLPRSRDAPLRHPARRARLRQLPPAPLAAPAAGGARRDRAAPLPSRYVGADGRAYAPLRDESHDEVPGAAAAAVRHGMGQLAARLAPIADQQRVSPERRPLRRCNPCRVAAGDRPPRRPPRRPPVARALAAAAPAPAPAAAAAAAAVVLAAAGVGRGARLRRVLARSLAAGSATPPATPPRRPSPRRPPRRTCRSRRWRRCRGVPPTGGGGVAWPSTPPPPRTPGCAARRCRRWRRRDPCGRQPDRADGGGEAELVALRAQGRRSSTGARRSTALDRRGGAARRHRRRPRPRRRRSG